MFLDWTRLPCNCGRCRNPREWSRAQVQHRDWQPEAALRRREVKQTTRRRMIFRATSAASDAVAGVTPAWAPPMPGAATAPRARIPGNRAGRWQASTSLSCAPAMAAPAKFCPGTWPRCPSFETHHRGNVVRSCVSTFSAYPEPIIQMCR